MKKLLLSFLPLLLVVLGGFSASAQDFSTTVTWATPGSIEVIKGGNPTLSTAEKMTLGPDQTSFTVTSDESAYWFKAAEGYTLEGATPVVNGKAYIMNLYGIVYFKLDPTFNKWKDLDGKTFTITTGLVEYEGEFTLDINNGADMVTLTMYDSKGDATRTLTPKDGKTTVPLIKGETTMWIKTQSYTALYEVKVGDQVVEWKSLRYTVPITNGCTVYIAGVDPATAAQKYSVTFKFTNNNPGCVSSVRNWSTNSFVENFANGFEVTPGTIIQVNRDESGDYTYNSITANGQASEFNKKLTINENTEFVIDATTKVYPAQTATVYVNDIDGLTFNNSIYDANAKEISVTKVADKAANTVTLGSYTVKVPTTEYTLGNISGKTKNVFFDVKDGYWLKEGVIAHPEDPQDYYLAGASAFKVEEAPVYFNVGKIDFNAPVKIYYQGPENVAHLRAKYNSASGEVTTVTYGGARPNETIAQGWSEIMIDPEYDSYFEISMQKEGASANFERFVCLDGQVLTPNSDEGEAPGVYQGVVLKKNSVIYIFFQEKAPEAHTLSFLTAGDAKATLTNGGITVTDFSAPVTGYGDMKDTLTPEAGTKVIVNGQEVAAGKYEFTAVGGTTTKIQLVKEGFTTLACSTDPAEGATVKSLASATLTLAMSNFENGSSPNIVEDAASWITVTTPNGEVAVASIEPGESEAGMSLNINFLTPVTAAGTCTVTIPAGVAYETFWDDATETFVRTAQSRVNPEIKLTVTVDPNMVYKWSFTPESGSENEMPEDDVIIVLSLSDAKTLDTEAFEAGTGPWLTYNGQAIYRSDDIYETPGWDFTQTMATYGKPAVAIAISKDIFKTAGELVINADAGAFTVNGSEASPELSYTAKFGKAINYTYEFTPAANTEITDWSEFTLTFPEATTVAVDEENCYMVFMQGYSWGTSDIDVSVSGNKVTLKPISESSPKGGTVSFRIGEGAFILDGQYPSPEIGTSWTFKRTTPINFEWQPDPHGNIVNDGYGLYAAIAYDEAETVDLGENFSGIVVKFNGEALPAYDWENEDVMGKEVVAEGGNVLLVNIYGAAADVEGEMSVSIPAGALLISGEPNPAAIEYTWKVVAKKEYTYVITPTPESTVSQLSELTIEFTNAETAVLHDSFVNAWIGVWKGYSMIASATSVEAVAGAGHPTFKVTFAPLTEAGRYRITFSDQTFYFDNAQGSDFIQAWYEVDPTYTGIEGVGAESGLFTVYNLQGILVLSDATADDVKVLPAGIYIVNGKKVALK